MDMNERVGWIGLGMMGQPMAQRLSEHFEVVAYDANQDRYTGAPGVVGAASLRDALSQVTAIFLSLPNSDAVQAVCLGDDGIERHAQPGTLVFDMSTTEPTVSRRIHQILERKGIAFIDSPVSGGPAGAQSGTLSIMAGCDADQWDLVRRWLSHLGTSVVRVGDVGSGGVAKLVNNMIVGGAFVAVAEGFAVAASQGVDIEALHAAIRSGWAQSKVLDLSADAVIAGDFAPTGTVDLLSKDLGYARNLARQAHVPIPLTSIVDEVFTSAKASGRGGSFQAVIITLWERLMGITIAGRKKHD